MCRLHWMVSGGYGRDKIETDNKVILVWNFLVNWLADVALIYGMTFGRGKLIFGDLIVGGILLFIAGTGFLIIYIGLRKGFG